MSEGLLTKAGAVEAPSEYATIAMVEQFTGLWTQAGPFRDPAVPYLYGKFYGASRIDRIIDGINREIGSRLTDVRRPGNPVFNANTFPAAYSLGSWKYVQNAQEIVRDLLDGRDGTIYDCTAGQKSSLLTKASASLQARMLGVNTSLYIGDGGETKKILESGTAWTATTDIAPGTLINQGASPGVMYMALGGMTLKVVATSITGGGSSWQHLVYFDPTAIPLNFANLVGVNVSFSGFTIDTTLNGKTLAVDTVLSTTLGILQVTTTTGSAQAYTQDTGSGTTGNGTTGGSLPSFTATRLAVTQDAGQQWKSYGTAAQNMGLTAPTLPAVLAPVSPARFWQPNTAFPLYTSLLDDRGNIEVVAKVGAALRSGTSYPTWATAAAAAATIATNIQATVNNNGSKVPGTIYQNTGANPELQSGYAHNNTGSSTGTIWALIGPTSPPTIEVWANECTATVADAPVGFTFNVPAGWYYQLNISGDVHWVPGHSQWYGTALSPVTTGVSTPAGANAVTVDGGLNWYNLGQPGVWQADAANAGVQGGCLLDSNGNLQWLFDGVGGTSGLTQPAWGTTLGASVTDGGLTWVCISTGGSGASLTYQELQWAYSLHAIDGTVSTASPVAIVFGGILGVAQTPNQLLTMTATEAGLFTDTQIDQIWIWRTAQGQATLILEDQIPADGLTNTFTYTERDIPDTSATGGAELNALIPAPINKTADPPPAGFLPMCYAQGRVWGVLDNKVIWSAGPDAVTGNGNTQFPPLNSAAGLGKAYNVFPSTIQAGGSNGALLVSTSSGLQIVLGDGSTLNPYIMTSYFASVNVAGFNCVSYFNQMLFVLEANRKVSAVAIEYPFNPQTGYTEIGFPIGDQFQKVTTGGFNADLFTPASSFVTWNNQDTSENALYVSDGAGHWFRMSQVPQPETGWVWDPIASIAGGASAVQSVETSPGVFRLLLAPAVGTTGPLLARDVTDTVFEDNGVAYPAWDVKGSIVMCASGEEAEVAHIAAKSAAVGSRPKVSVLLNEIASSPKRPWSQLELTANDPPLLSPSLSYYSDRYKIQGGAPEVCDTMLLKFDYGTQNAGDELQMFSVYGAKHAERKQQ